MSAALPLLSIRQLSKSFGGLAVTCAVDCDVMPGSRVAMIGPNGAGKTTLFNLICGVERPDAGDIVFDGASLIDVPSRQRIARGLARSFQNIRLMPHLSVVENVMLGQHAQVARSFGALLSPRSLSRRSRWRQAAEHRLADLGVTAFDASVDSLPYGIRKKIEVVRALMAEPKLLLLDEPAAGLNPTETAALRDFLHVVSAQGVTLLVVEHDMSFVRQLCPQAIVLNFGRKIYDGPTARVHEDAAVVEAYLGHPRDGRHAA